MKEIFAPTENGNKVMTMAEYIEREKLLRDINHYHLSDGKFQHWVEVQQAADVSPVRHGRWIDAYPDIEPNPMCMYGICSECGFEQGISKYLNYCPNCGADMRGEEE